MSDDSLRTQEKALKINADPAKYGTFAEIGAGQEVVRWFYHVGMASNTVAKSMSAYDMVFSDAIYGPAARYVSRNRLESMLEREYALLLERLDKTRGEKSTFFVFADTVATHTRTRNSAGQGWMGVLFQAQPKQGPSRVMIHVRLPEVVRLREQESLGILGVNLIYGAYFFHHDPCAYIASLMDDLSRSRVEVDMIQFDGPAFDQVDNRLMSLQLVQQNLTDAVMFTPDGTVAEPAEILYQRPILAERGSFRPITNVTLQMLERGRDLLSKDPDVRLDQLVEIAEMTLSNLMSENNIDHADFLARVDFLAALGKTVLISNFGKFHQIVSCLRRHTQMPLSFVLGVPTLRQLFSEGYYTDLPGGILEAMGLLFQGRVRLYVHPVREGENPMPTGADNLDVPAHLTHLYRHLRENGLIESLAGFDQSQSAIFPGDVLQRIQSGDAAWEQMVPGKVAEMIKRRGLFGYRDLEAPVTGGAVN